MIIVEGQIFKIAASRFVNLSEEEINLMKENAIPRNTNTPNTPQSSEWHSSKVSN